MSTLLMNQADPSSEEVRPLLSDGLITMKFPNRTQQTGRGDTLMHVSNSAQVRGLFHSVFVLSSWGGVPLNRTSDTELELSE